VRFDAPRLVTQRLALSGSTINNRWTSNKQKLLSI
jgi:hypothetical protein